MRPVFKIENHDYTAFLAADGLQPSRNDLDASGSGRDILSGLMYRARIAQKDKWVVKFNRLPELVMQSLSEDINPTYVNITMLNPRTNRITTKTYYTSTLTYGTQRYNSDNCTYYDGCTFSLTER